MHFEGFSTCSATFKKREKREREGKKKKLWGFWYERLTVLPPGESTRYCQPLIGRGTNDPPLVAVVSCSACAV